MCKYCEEIDSKDDNEFELWNSDDCHYSLIQYCPWCGRKLEVPEEKPEVAITKDDFDLLLRKYDKLQKDVGNLWGCLLNHYKYEDENFYHSQEFTNFVHALEKLM